MLVPLSVVRIWIAGVGYKRLPVFLFMADLFPLTIFNYTFAIYSLPFFKIHTGLPQNR